MLRPNYGPAGVTEQNTALLGNELHFQSGRDSSSDANANANAGEDGSAGHRYALFDSGL